MPDKYENKQGVHIDVHTDKGGKDHVSFYDKDPKNDDHKAIHINIDSKTGKGTIVDNTSGDKQTTDTKCFLTSACMRHFQEKFDDNCYELYILRWFRDNFISKSDIEHYYQTAPVIVSAIESEQNRDIIYDYIYENVVMACVDAIESGDYHFAYSRYKSSVLGLEETFAKKELQRSLIKTLRNPNDQVEHFAFG